MIRVGIVGGTGYTGVELLRLLAQHPQAVGSDHFTFRGGGEGRRHVPEPARSWRPAVQRAGRAAPRRLRRVFFATPHGGRTRWLAELLDAGTRVIDLSADFRLADAGEWARWYGQPHGAPALLDEAVHGLPEVNREKIRQAPPDRRQPRLLPDRDPAGPDPAAGGRPGRRLAADRRLQVRGQRRTRSAKVGSLFCEAGESMMAYAVAHGHLPEISQGPASASGGDVGPDVRTAPDANDPRYPVQPCMPMSRIAWSTSRRCSRSATPTKPSST
ncbi:hypothetical protein ACPA9J_35870 [Pseudomonas aeruginosa]